MTPQQRQYKYIERERLDRHMTLEGEPPPFLIEGVVQRSVTLLYGQTGSGKSSLALGMSIAVASGQPEWLGQRIATDGPMPVVIVAGDPDGKAEYKEMLHPVRGQLGDGSIDVVAPYRPTKPEGWEEVRSVVRDTGARLVVLDNLSQFVPGSLSDDDMIKLFYEEVDLFPRDYSAAALVIAHVSEKWDSNGKPSRLPMGSSSIRFGPRWWGFAWKSDGRVRVEFDGNRGRPWSMDVSEPDGTPAFRVLSVMTPDELAHKREERRQRTTRGRVTLARRDEIRALVLAEQPRSERAAARLIADRFGMSENTARDRLRDGAYGVTRAGGTWRDSRGAAA
jgi:hypothetical protein